MAKRKPRYVFTSTEISMMLIVLSKLDPDKYASPEMKALIFKCKAAVLSDDITLTISN